MKRDVYSGRLKLLGEKHEETLRAANNYADSLKDLERFEEAKALLRKTVPVVRRVSGEDKYLTLVMRLLYAMALYADNSATFGDLREAVATLEDTERTARRVMGGAHPLTQNIGRDLQIARKSLHLRRMRSICEAVGAMTPGV